MSPSAALFVLQLFAHSFRRALAAPLNSASRAVAACHQIFVEVTSSNGTDHLIRRFERDSNINSEVHMGRGLLLWLIGIPIPIILIVWLLGGLHG